MILSTSDTYLSLLHDAEVDKQLMASTFSMIFVPPIIPVFFCCCCFFISARWRRFLSSQPKSYPFPFHSLSSVHPFYPVNPFLSFHHVYSFFHSLPFTLFFPIHFHSVCPFPSSSIYPIFSLLFHLFYPFLSSYILFPLFYVSSFPSTSV